MTRTRTALGAAIGATLVTAAVLAAPAQAAPAGATVEPSPAEKVATSLGTARTGGVYVAGGRITIAVTDATAAKAVTDAGGTARLVTRSAAALERSRASLETPLRGVAGTAWGVDASTNQVVVAYDSRVKGAQLESVKKAVAGQGAAARLEAMPGKVSKLISGGQSIYNAGGTCSLGFNTKRGQNFFFLTAGHCTALGGNWFQNRTGTNLLGPTVGGLYPGNDFGVVKNTNANLPKPGNVFLYNGRWQDIRTAANAAVGQAVRRSGRTTGLRSGTVTGLNFSVNYGDGEIVSGLTRTNACAEPGDSGGPFFFGTVAYGLTSGGSGTCASGGTTFFQPVVEALNHYGVRIY